MSKRAYVLTDKAGDWVAGQKIRDRKRPLLLTASQAEYELRLGTIVLQEVDLLPGGPKPKGKR